MFVSGFVKNEFVVCFGVVFGMYVKCVMIILWVFCGLIGIVFYSGEGVLVDFDVVWGMMFC